MTYKQLLEQLQDLTEEQLNQTVTVYESQDNEFFMVDHTAVTNESDVLDEDHFFLVLTK